MQTTHFANLSMKDISIPARLIRKNAFVDEDFVNFMKARGLLQPIGVREIAPGYFELVFGYRRYLGAIKAELETVPCIIMELNDKQSREIMLAENGMREDPKPMEVAEFVEGLKHDFGYLEKDIAAIIDKSDSYVSNILRIYREPFLREEVQSGRITFSMALELLTIQPDLSTDPVGYQGWKTFGAKSSAIGSSKAIGRLKGQEKLAVIDKKKPVSESVSDSVSSEMRDQEIRLQKVTGDVSRFTQSLILLALSVALTLISRGLSEKNSQENIATDVIRGQDVPHYVPANPAH